MATLSTVISNLPTACPTEITTSGLWLSVLSSIFSKGFLNTVGISTLITSTPEMIFGNALTASKAGLIVSLVKLQPLE